MAITKNQVLNLLEKIKDKNPNKKSAKYIALGVAAILVRKDLITIEDILIEFPELAE